MTEILDIVNEHDEVIGQIERSKKDDSHIVRVIFIGYYTPDKKIILQKRSQQKKNNPGKLTASVSGHVESGMSYEDTAVKEALEESGIVIDRENLISLGVMFGGDVMRAVFAYPFDGNIDDLKVEEGEGDGFVAMDINDLKHELADKPDKFTPFFSSPAGASLIDYIEQV